MYHRGGQIIQGICNSTAALVFEAEHKAMTYREIANPPPAQTPPKSAIRQDWHYPPASLQMDPLPLNC